MASLPVIPSSWRNNSNSSIQDESARDQAPSSPDNLAESAVLVDVPPLEVSEQSGSEVAMPSEEIMSRRCWICQGDDVEDETPREWRSPCQCSLTAHEECLLEWVSSQEAPRNGEMAVSHEIICPQCKGPITIARPFDPLVYAVDHIQSAVKHLTTTTAIGVLGCTAWSALFIYGQNTIYTVFGEEDAARLLLPPEQPYELPVFARHIHRFFHKIDSILLPFGPWRALLLNPWIHVTLPLIGPSLVLWRYDVGERLFNLVPSMVLAARLISEAFKGPKYRHQMVAIWPPTAGLAFASLPYIKSVYNEVYKRSFADLEKKWDAAVLRKPREGETAADVAAEQRDEGFQLGNIEVGIEMREVWAGGEEGEEIPPPRAEDLQIAADIVHAMIEIERNRDHDDDDSDDDDDAIPALEPAPAQPPVNDPLNPANPIPPPGNNNVQFPSLPVIVRTVMGALFLPTISATMGDILALTLPARLVNATRWSRNQAFLQQKNQAFLHQKWGRTIAGGCLFVVLKDAVVLYCKWRKARDFGRKRVLDFKGKRGVL